MKIWFISIAILVSIINLNCRSSAEVTESFDEEIPELSEEQVLAQAQADSIAEAQAKEEELRNSLIELYKDEIYARYQAQANTLTKYYILAQQHFFSGDFENALFLVNRAALIKENADVLALRGSIYLGLGYINEFVNQWRRALEMDPDVPIPSSTYIIQQLQNNGLIDENLKKAF
jgi:tetratricopeptide (TPR) repeat protein